MCDKYKMNDSVNEYLKKYNHILEKMICGMTNAHLTDSISYNFMIQMIPHHRAAIEMSQNLLDYSCSIPLIDIAENIITEQTKSIENMQNIMCCCDRFVNCRHALCSYQRAADEIMETMFCKMKHAYADCNIDADFMREMIPHHKGAILLSKNALKYDICPELVPILKAIIISQEKGVKEMERLLLSEEGKNTHNC